MRRFFVLGSLLLLTACGSADLQPVINFIGVATGALATDLSSLHFSDRFAVTDRQLVGVAGFSHIEEGSTVQATWFSPDDRHMPLGRTSIVAESGATIVRFSFASSKNWQPAPYMLRIDAMTSRGERQFIGTGSLQFFIGQSDADIAAYQTELTEWKKAEAIDRIKIEEMIKRNN